MTQSNPNSSNNKVKNPIPGVVYPDQKDLDRYLAEGVLTRETLCDGFRKVVEAYPENVALVGPGLRLTYSELDSLSDRLAGAFIKQGLRPLDRAVFQLRDSEKLVITFLACLKIGVIPICTLYAHREREIGYLANHAGAKLHVVEGADPKFDSVAFAKKMQREVSSLQMILKMQGEPEEGVLQITDLIDGISKDAAEAALKDIELDPFQVAVFQLSGGTTGVPKIIPRFQNEYLYNMRAVANWLDYTPDDVLFMPQPMVHNLNMGCCFGPFLMTGGTYAIAPDLQPETLIDLIATTKPTWFMLGGPIVARLEKAIEEGVVDLSSAKGVIVANSAAKLRNLLGVRTHNIFGMTEGVIMLVHKDDPVEMQDTSNGRPVSDWDSVKILVPGTEKEVAPGEVGEPAFKGPYTIRGYFDAEERNKDAFTSDGYYRSGDLMYTKEVDGKTYYFFCGRLKDLVSRGGEKINCEEVELAVSHHPAVASVMAVGYPDPVMDERLCATIILRDGHEAPSVTELGKFLEKYGLAKFKWPERIEVLETFPLSASGKVSKEQIKKLVAANVEQERKSQTPSH